MKKKKRMKKNEQSIDKHRRKKRSDGINTLGILHFGLRILFLI